MSQKVELFNYSYTKLDDYDTQFYNGYRVIYSLFINLDWFINDMSQTLNEQAVNKIIERIYNEVVKRMNASDEAKEFDVKFRAAMIDSVYVKWFSQNIDKKEYGIIVYYNRNATYDYYIEICKLCNDCFIEVYEEIKKEV